MIASWIPFKSKRYIAKWANIRKDWIENIYITTFNNNTLRAYVSWKSNFTYFNSFTEGISMRDLWDNLLNQISEIENMRNVEELKIWLDTQII